MKRCIVIFAIVASMLLVSNVALAGRNYGGYANLTWVLGNHVRFIELPPGYQFLYVRLEQIQEIVGCEFAMSWNRDAGPGYWDCFDLVDVSAPTGTDCYYLMRGTVISVIEDWSPSYIEAAFAGSDWVSVCTGGQTVRLAFSFIECDLTETGWFCLDFCKVTDHFGMIDEMTVINGNPGWSCAYIVGPTAAEPATWGSIKAMYR